MIKPGSVISISYARVYVFKGTKQIQMDFRLSKLY